MKVIFRLDANQTIGHGHLSRCLNLAYFFHLKSWEVYICSNDDIYNIPYKVITEDMIPNFQPIDLLVVDHYGIDILWETEMRPYVHKIIVIDDLANRKHNCDYIIDVVPKSYDGLVPSHCQTLLGSQYALLYHQYAIQQLDISKIPPKRILISFGGSPPMKRILISFGGTDLHQQTSRITNLITKYRPQYPLNIICYDFKLEAAPENVIIWSKKLSQDEMIDVYQQSYFCIGAGGVSSYERACVGLPSIIITVADNQEYVAQYIHDMEIAQYLGRYNEVTDDMILNAVDRMWDDAEFWKRCGINGMKTVDGQGCARVARLF